MRSVVRWATTVLILGSWPAMLAFAGCSMRRQDSGASSESPALAMHAIESSTLENLFRLSARIYCGGEPRGERAFAELARLGVRTVVSVDGARPDVAGARAYGLRYVHIPLGYDRIDVDGQLSLTRLVREAAGPFYIHCHHGRHRGPAAAAMACMANGDADRDAALRILERAGTSRDYAGLWRDVADYRPPPADADWPELVEVADAGSLAAAMAAVDRAYDNVKRCREAGWETPVDHPDLAVMQQALLLREALHEAERILDDDADADLRTWLAAAHTTACRLEVSLESGTVSDAAKYFNVLSRSCTRCHARFRD